jgi:ribonuclease Z
VVWRGHRPPVEIRLVTLEPGTVILEDERLIVSAFPVHHRGPGCFGFTFEERSRRPFLAAEAEALGVPFGPERARLVRGESVTLADGRVISPEQVLGAEIPGTKYVHIGDVGRTQDLVEHCRGATCLTIEATYMDEEAPMAEEFGHLTARQAARLAREAGVGTLILTHLSRRYFGRDVRDEARALFPASYVARDLDQFQITRDGVTRLPRRRRRDDVEEVAEEIDGPE